MAVTRDQIQRYISKPLSDEQIQERVSRHIDVKANGFGISRARLQSSGASVAAVIADLEALNGDVQKTAEDFNASVDDVLAAVLFYWQHQDVIDAEITVRRSGFMD